MTRRTVLLAALGALAAAPGVDLLRRRGYDRARRRSYEALVEALIDQGALPGPPAEAGARLSVLYGDALPGRRREIDVVLDALSDAQFARIDTAARIRVLRRWTAAGGERRALAGRALALAAAAYGPAADRALPVVI